MTTEIQNKIDELVTLVRAKSPANAVGFNLFVNSSEYEAEYRYRDAESLKADGISMRALCGDFIRANKPNKIYDKQTTTGTQTSNRSQAGIHTQSLQG